MAKIWDSKQYNRINWQNRPSTATALGATNLNKIDVFCNNVDNALIQIDADKLNIETANSMLASVSFNSDTGTFTFKELDGTTYTYDLNLEKIPVSFSLSEDGILTMTTEDGTQWTCNIGELIKDYVFEDSDTIAFSKEFVEEDDEGKGCYHISADVKNGSITAEKLNPDYRSDILTYKTQAQEAANDSLTYSKDSKRWAVGDAEYEGSATDNAKYYKEQAEIAKQAAEDAADRAAQVADVDIATTTKAGIVKPDGTTLDITTDGILSVKKATASAPGIVKPDGVSIGVEVDGTIKSLVTAASLLIKDNQELVVPKEGDVVQDTTTQLLIDAIADKVVNELVSNTSLMQTLGDYVAKSAIVQVESTSQSNVPSSAYLKTVKDSLDSDISELNANYSYIFPNTRPKIASASNKRYLKIIGKQNQNFGSIILLSQNGFLCVYVGGSAIEKVFESTGNRITYSADGASMTYIFDFQVTYAHPIAIMGGGIANSDISFYS